MAFSGVLQVTELNDYIGASQACIKPVEIKKAASAADQGTLRHDEATGTFYEVMKDGEEKALETATISLNDCLACSGCITSAETMLVAAQSNKDLYKVLASNREYLQSNPSVRGNLSHISTYGTNTSQEEPAPFNSSYKLVVVSISPQSRASFAAKYGLDPLSVHRRLVTFLRNLGVHHVIDSAFARDFSLLESSREFVRRYRKWLDAKGSRPSLASSSTASLLPVLASACPGWICYAEKTHGHLVDNISSTKSPQQIMGSIVKNYLADRYKITPDSTFHVSVMPCYDKKLEASRSDFYNDVYRTRDVDTVLTTKELDNMMKESGVTMESLEEASLVDFLNKVGPSLQSSKDSILYGTEGSSSGGYVSYVLRYAAWALYGLHVTPHDVEHGRPEAPLIPASPPPLFSRIPHSPSPSTSTATAAATTTATSTTPSSQPPTPFGAAAASAAVASWGVHVRPGRNPDTRRVVLRVNGADALVFATSYGFRNIQNVVRKIRPAGGSSAGTRAGGDGGGGALRARASRASVRAGGRSAGAGAGAASADAADDVVHYVEVMACPSGCINGAGQLKPAEFEASEEGGVNAPAPKAFITKAEEVYRSVAAGEGSRSLFQAPEENERVLGLYRDWLGGFDTDKARELLHTQYRAVGVGARDDSEVSAVVAMNW
ncbi:iron hydrogenase [Zopfochytrium polystomum]|nr:iron hydrogenase [Zopfochytrium polystomum]